MYIDSDELYSPPNKKLDLMEAEMRSLKGEVLTYRAKEAIDAELRSRNPGLQELWDQYQTMKKLVGDNE